MVEPSTSQQEDSPLKPITRSFTDLSLSSGISSASSASSQRKLPPPYNPNTLPLVGISRASTFGSSPSTPSTPTRKPVPPTQHRVLAPLAPTSMPPPPDSMLFKKSPPRIPQKPSGLLQAPLIPGNPSTDAATDAPPPPPPRRKPVPYERISIPPLPPRTAGAGGIMDSEDAESVSSLSWEPLKPT